MVLNPAYDSGRTDRLSAEDEYNFVKEPSDIDDDKGKLHKIQSRKSDPNYYSVVGGQATMHTDSLPDQIYNDAYESFDTADLPRERIRSEKHQKDSGSSESKKGRNNDESSNINEIPQTPLYSEVNEAKSTSPFEVLSNEEPDKPVYGKLDKKGKTSKSGNVDRETNQNDSEEEDYSEVKDKLTERKNSLYTEVTRDDRESIPHFVVNTANEKEVEAGEISVIPEYGKIDKKKQRSKNSTNCDIKSEAKVSSNGREIVQEEETYSEVKDAMKRMTPLYTEVTANGNGSILHSSEDVAQRTVQHGGHQFGIPLYGKINKNKDKDKTDDA